MRWNAIALALVCSAAIAGCSRAQDDAAFGAKVRAYLMAHPEVIKEAADKYNASIEAQAAANARLALAANRKAIEGDVRDFVANPAGKITVTEFYDYRCPHCVNVAPKVIAFIQKNPDVRFVFKEMPIFGEQSERAAVAALTVKKAGGDYLGVHRDMMAARPLDPPAIDRILKAHGVDPAAVDPATTRTANAQLADTADLARKLGVGGTPTFIIGDTVVPGEDMDAVEAAVAVARKAKG